MATSSDPDPHSGNPSETDPPVLSASPDQTMPTLSTPTLSTDAELDELLGAFALNAVDRSESEQIDAYLLRSPRARHEVSDHLEVAAALGNLGADRLGTVSGGAPPRLWDQIAGSLPPRAVEIPTDTRPALSAPANSAPANSAPANSAPATVTSITGRSTSRLRRMTAPLLVAASITMIGGLSTIAFRQSDRIGDLEQQVAAAQQSQEAAEIALEQALDAPDTRVVSLTDPAGAVMAKIALASNGTGYMFASQLPQLQPGMTYQLWGVSDGVVLSLGLFEADNRPMPFAAAGQYTQLVMTAEQGPGVAVSSAKAVAAAAVV
jgi:hypothetical protein